MPFSRLSPHCNKLLHIAFVICCCTVGCTSPKSVRKHLDFRVAESQYLYLIAESYYRTHLHYPDDIDALIAHGIPLHNMSSAVDSYIGDFRHLYKCFPTDSSFLITFKNIDTVLYMNERLRCVDFSLLLSWRLSCPVAQGLDQHDSVYRFRRDSSDTFYSSLLSLYDTMRGSHRPVLNRELFDSVSLATYPACNDDPDMPALVLYQYVPAEGLSLHPLCKDCISMQSAEYTDSLARMAEQICRQYQLKYLRFLAYDMVKSTPY